MLSHDLRTLSVWFDACCDSEFGFTAEGVKAFARVLCAAIDKAEALEQATMNTGQPCGVREISGDMETLDASNVVVFPVVARPRPAEAMP